MDKYLVLLKADAGEDYKTEMIESYSMFEALTEAVSLHREYHPVICVTAKEWDEQNKAVMKRK